MILGRSGGIAPQRLGHSGEGSRISLGLGNAEHLIGNADPDFTAIGVLNHDADHRTVVDIASATVDSIVEVLESAVAAIEMALKKEQLLQTLEGGGNVVMFGLLVVQNNHDVLVDELLMLSAYQGTPISFLRRLAEVNLRHSVYF